MKSLDPDRRMAADQAWRDAEEAFRDGKMQIIPSFREVQSVEQHSWYIGGRQQPSFRREPAEAKEEENKT